MWKKLRQLFCEHAWKPLHTTKEEKAAYNAAWGGFMRNYPHKKAPLSCKCAYCEKEQ